MTKLENKQVWKIYRSILLMRRFEERVVQLYQDKFIQGFCHPYIGQEAVLAGIKEVMLPVDKCITSYRCHAHMLAFGATSRSVMAELTGRRDGCSLGKGGSMHMFHPEGGFYGGHGIVGAYVSLGTGIGLSQKYQKTGGVSVTFFGDGASNQGQVFESFNLASLLKLPVLYVIENNGYGIGTSSERSCAGGPLYKRGEPFGIPGMEADGMNVFDMMEKAQEAIKYAREHGPIVLEAKTYRYKGHSVSDPATYRPKEEVQSMKNRDPISSLETYLNENDPNFEETLKNITKSVMDEVRDSIEFAKSSPEPDLSELYTNIYSGDYGYAG
jgi:pyruvate dehydrogenase E1 component alpha subunit